MTALTQSSGTVTLTGDVEKVTLPACYGWVWVKNLSDSDICAGLSADVSEGSDGVMTIASGDAGRVQVDGREFYLLGRGKVWVTAQTYTDCPFKAGAKGGVGDNLLINPDFKINQRGISGTFSETGKYFVDRWKLTAGTVTVNSDGSLTLNGSISQVFENAVGDNVTVSISAGTANYDNSTKTFSITANGETISWVKMGYGKTATPFVLPEPTAELMKCQRYYQVVDLGQPVYAIGIGPSIIRFGFTLPTDLRTYPTAEFVPITGDYTWAISFVNLSTGAIITTNDAPEVSGVVARTRSRLNISLNVNSNDIAANMGYLIRGVGGFKLNLDAEIY